MSLQTGVSTVDQCNLYIDIVDSFFSALKEALAWLAVLQGFCLPRLQVGIASSSTHQNPLKTWKWRFVQKISEVSSPKGPLKTSYKLTKTSVFPQSFTIFPGFSP